ncbi:lycopene beta-cyclase CrtY [Sphingomonas qomolangmaensis]|uniref:Lycopene beta-cyclase CrtY n=1 Tax=Sphingomonas qomolangmaensis TaxID=2918765 RepID=A0ABY5L8Q8_9SPHN|nr:lycopene beta-cyclase CrtY [Sphingomonas qomolangmaensis]UUL81978.1 lycopene beta-cyclase CrtY [Sphingomonas qomolangmaensis]
MSSIIRCNVAIVGAGLAGGLIALALREMRPGCDVRLIDAAGVIGGNHVWSFFASDVAPEHRWILSPLITYGWDSYDIAFPAHGRTIREPYFSIESDRLDKVVREKLPPQALMLRRKVAEVTPTAVVLADGDRVEADGVIDCRGAGDLSHLDMGWQKFVGEELELAAPHEAPRPMVMDATVEQIDGYRFVYCLPFGRKRMFVEDTYYSDTPEIAVTDNKSRIAEYAAARGWQVERVARQESGALPVAFGGDFAGYWNSGGKQVAKAGMRAGQFHPLTGYSLPDAVRTAAAVARMTDYSGAALHEALHGMAASTWGSRRFYRMLSAMLFKAAEPEERYRVLERFYRLDARLVSRFYAGHSTAFDKLRVLTGKPPVPIGRAIAAIRETN